MSWSFPIGRLFGSELRIHVTFLLLLGWIAYAGWQAGGSTAAIAHTLFAIALFACVIAHEFGHALTARRYGIATPDITLLPIGGVARLERMPEKPGQEIVVALAGPAVNLAIWALLGLLSGAFGTAGGGSNGGALTGQTLASLPADLARVNLWIALFNLLPAFPMDGGRVLRALLAMRTDRVTATRRAAQAGQALALLMGLAGFATGNLILLLIGFFILMAAGAESSEVAMQSALRGLKARDAMITSYETLTPEDSLDAAAAALIRTTQHEFPVVEAPGGHPVGLLTRTDLFAALSQTPRPREVAAVMQRDLPRAGPEDELEKVLQLLADGAPAVMIPGLQGGLLGYVTRENVGELMVMMANRQQR